MQVTEHPDRLVFSAGRVPVATYVFRDSDILRPYFAHVHAPGGEQVTRHFPPRSGLDPTDHATMHPGIWLAFGDLSSGAVRGDFWRNKCRVEHLEFVEPPSVTSAGDVSMVAFTARQRYLTGDTEICRAVARHTVSAAPAGHWITFDCTFTGQRAFAFGDQEEMGLGVRVATPLAVKGGSGAITNSAGLQNEKQVWGQLADWCDYSGQSAAGQRSGLLVVPHAENFRRSWMHARDYGLVVANPFGQRAFTRAAESRVEIRPGEPFRLRYGVLAYAVALGQPMDFRKLAASYHKLPP